MKQMIIMTLIAVVFITSCKKETAPMVALPEETTSGKNTLGFLLDNKIWVNSGSRCTFAGCNDNKVTAHLYRQPNGDLDLEISAGYTVMSETIDQLFYIYTTNVTTAGNYMLDSSLNRGIKFIASRYSQNYKEYYNQVPGTCYLTITRFDTTNKIISGSFKGIIFNPQNRTDSTMIENGRFDASLDYKP